MIPDVLAQRYASAAMAALWAPEHRIAAERRLWLAVLDAQADLGIDIPDGVITDYARVIDDIDLASIAGRERVTRHDVKARIEEFNALAGHEHIHKGLTSRDLTENVEQMLIRESLLLVRDKVIAALARLSALAVQYADTPIAGRSHNVAAQTTTLGKRFATWADELLISYDRLTDLIERYPLRGIKGPVGTAQDMLDLLDGDATALAAQDRLEAAGLLALAIRPPTVPEGTSRLRLVLRAGLPSGTLEKLLEALGPGPRLSPASAEPGALRAS